jgi:subtilase family serine protease
MAPGAKILLVEANSNSFSDLNKALDYARNAAGVVAVSASWGGSEYSSESSNDVHFVTPTGHQGITFTVAAGDNGAPAEYPSSSPDVLSVGGSTLRVSSTGAWSSESAWSGGGGGSSFYEGLPSYQSGLGLSSRGTPDVTFNANPSTGFAVYDSYGSGGWAVYGGTSAGAPQWAALIAIADQGRALNGQSSLANAQSILYGLSRSDFHDVASGSNGYRAGSGYDLASGLGSPIANRLIPDLVAYNGSNSFTVASPPASSSRGGFTFFFTLPAVVLPDSSNMMSSFESGLINAAVPVAGNAEPQMAADTPANNLTMLTAVQSSNSIGIEATQHAPQLDSASSPSPSSLDDFFASLSNDL